MVCSRHEILASVHRIDRVCLRRLRTARPDRYPKRRVIGIVRGRRLIRVIVRHDRGMDAVHSSEGIHGDGADGMEGG